MHDGDVDWACRAAAAEQAVVRRHLRPIAGVLPGTRIGRVRWPRRMPAAAVPVALLVAGAPARLPGRRPAARPAPAPRGHDRHAHPQRAAPQRRAGGPTRSTTTSPGSASPSNARAPWPATAGCWARSPGSCTAAGPRTAGAASGGGAAVARTVGSRTRPRTGPPRSCWPAKARSSSPPRSPTGWPRRSSTPTPASSATGCGWPPTARSHAVDRRIFTYCQGVHLGACVELAARDGHQRWGDRAVALVDAVTHRLARPDGVLPGCGGGDGGLFAGILARYLVVAALRRPELTDAAARIVLASADAAWRGRLDGRCGPVFSAEWSRPAGAAAPRRGRGRPLRAALGLDGAGGGGQIAQLGRVRALVATPRPQQLHDDRARSRGTPRG